MVRTNYHTTTTTQLEYFGNHEFLELFGLVVKEYVCKRCIKLLHDLCVLLRLECPLYTTGPWPLTSC